MTSNIIYYEIDFNIDNIDLKLISTENLDIQWIKKNHINSHNTIMETNL